MKKLTQKQQERQRRLMAYRWRSDRYQYLLRRRARQNREKYGGLIYYLKAPEHFDLTGRYTLPLLQFIKRLTKAAASPDTGCIKLDFSSTEIMVADGTLYFLAHLERLKLLYPQKRFRMCPPSDAIVKQVLHHVGIASHLGSVKDLQPEKLHKTVRYWHKATGIKVEPGRAENVFGSFEGRITKELQRSVYTGVSEAMTNCLHHAYDGGTPEICRRWWLFSREYNGEMHVVFCDLGIGIPNSLYRKTEDVQEGWWDALRQWFRENRKSGQYFDDAMKIKAAIEIGRTRTKLGHRGKGLKQMVDFLEKIGHNSAKVSIYSGKGVYHRAPKNGKPCEFTFPLSIQDRKATIAGTLIHWSVPLIGGSD